MTASDPITLANNRRTGAFERRVARALASLVEAGAPVVVACSGGPDSVATLVAVARTRVADITAAHFDHRLRAPDEVSGERAVVEAVAAAVGARFTAGRAARAPTDRSETAARDARYRWLARACAAAGAVACVTGHTQDDQAETVLLRLVRGTGLHGAAGMSAASTWPVPLRGLRGVRGLRAGGGPRLVRPLLGIARAEVEAYLEALGIKAADDPSNETLDYARNRVRRWVIPELRALNPRAAAQIAAFADRARADDAALDAWAAGVSAAITRPAAGGVALGRGPLLALPVAVAARVVRLAAAGLGIALDSTQAEATLHAAGARGRRAALGRGVAAWREGARLVIGRAGAEEDSPAGR